MKKHAPDGGPGVHGEPDREEPGDVGDGDHPAHHHHGIRDSAHSISDHQLWILNFLEGPVDLPNFLETLAIAGKSTEVVSWKIMSKLHEW